jgi:peroxiredoxin
LSDRINPLYKANEPINKIFIERYYKYPDSIFNDSIASKQAAGEKKINAYTREFIADYPNNRVSIKLLNNYKVRFKKEVVSELYTLMNEEFRNTLHGKSINEYLTLSKNLKIGDRYIDFEQETPEGKRIKLSDHLGPKYTLIEFWASWCGPCRRANPKVVEHYSKYKDKGFKIIGVSLDTNKESWVKAIDQDQLPWINMSDLKGYQNEAALIYDVSGLPNGILLNEEGVIIAIGLRDGTLKKKLEELFDD